MTGDFGVTVMVSEGEPDITVVVEDLWPTFVDLTLADNRSRTTLDLREARKLRKALKKAIKIMEAGQ